MSMNSTRDGEINKLKAELKRAYAAMQYSAPDHSCGHALTKHISVEYSEACRRVNTILDALAAIDPTAPKTRF